MRVIFEMISKKKINQIELTDKYFFMYENGLRQRYDVDKEKSIEILLSLFSLQEKWKKYYCTHPRYKITFINKKETKTYRLGRKYPNNWLFFYNILIEFVGDYAWKI